MVAIARREAPLLDSLACARRAPPRYLSAFPIRTQRLCPPVESIVLQTVLIG
jgi:hypothetical protein